MYIRLKKYVAEVLQGGINHPFASKIEAASSSSKELAIQALMYCVQLHFSTEMRKSTEGVYRNCAWVGIQGEGPCRNLVGI